MKLGFIGTGIMGASMADHLLNAGYTLYVYNRTPEKAQKLIEQGAIWQDSPKSIAQNCDIIMTMLGYPMDVEQIYFDPVSGLIPNAASGTLLIDFTTAPPKLAEKIYESARARELKFMDAPVSGGDIGARDALLTIMCGGDSETFEQCLPILKLLGKNVRLQGGPGAGQHTKMCNQIALAGAMTGVCEALAYAEAAGLNASNVLESIQYGAAGSWCMTNYGPRILKGDHAPGFMIRHFIKDMKIAIDEAQDRDVKIPGLVQNNSFNDDLAASGHGTDGMQALSQWYKN